MRKSRNILLLAILTAVLVVAALVFMTWQNYRFSKNNRAGNDFLVSWMSTRLFLTQGTSPYSDETAQKIQIYANGHPAEKGEPQIRMVYPLYSIAVIFPFALISDFTMARAVFMTVLEAALIALAFFSIRLVRWRVHFWELVVFVLFSLAWYHSVRPLIDGNLTILVALLMVSGLLALKNGGDELAGILFAFATIKPNLVFLPILYICIWSMVNGRWRLIGWLIGSLFLLSSSAALLLPDWIWQNFRVVVNYSSYGQVGTLGAVLAATFPAMGERIARLVYGVLAGMVITEWWFNRHAEFPGFLWTMLFSMTINQWIGIPTAPQNFIILLPALALVFSTWEERWRRAGSVLSSLSMVLLFVGIWALFLNTANPGSTPSQNPLMFLPLPAFLVVTLYWVRWWAVRPPNVWFDYIAMKERL